MDALLRRALTINAWFSGASALLMLAAAERIAELLGPAVPALLLRLLGVGLLLFAATAWGQARRVRIEPRAARAILWLDDAWVIASAVLLLGFPQVLAPAGQWLVGLVAAVVAGFAVAEFIGLRRLQTAAAN